jgi:O-acetyl-ADP-ribose deacetylase (regulator of RNase III)/uncharacterized protein YwgA
VVTVLIGDLFDSQAQTLVNTVNCVGVMGKGVALEFKQRFPDMFADYAARCQRREVRLGGPYLFKRLLPPWILNFPTKGHWRAVTNLQDLIGGLEYLQAHYQQWNIQSLAVPPLGCGHGQLEWRVVGPTLYRHLSRLAIPVELYAPHGTPHDELHREFLGGAPPEAVAMPEPRYIKPEWIAVVDVLYRLEQQPYHCPVGRTTFQKIAFVLTEEGLDTGLAYRRGSYGPYAPELKPMLGRLLNNGLIEETQLGRMLQVRTGRTFPDARRAYAHQLTAFEPVVSKTADLFQRVHSTDQAEIVATILFAARELARQRQTQPAEKEVFDAVLRWKQRRRPPLALKEIAHHIRNLAALSWLDVTASPDLPLPEDELAEV